MGLILLECLTAEREYPGTLAESAMARLNRPPRIPAGVPASLALTLSRMIALEPAERPAAEQIRPLLCEPVDATIFGTVPVAAPMRRRLVATVAGGGLVTAAAAAILAVALTGPDIA